MLRVQAISIVVYAFVAWIFVVPWLRRVEKAQALSALLLVHVFRYVVLYLYVAKREGYAISDAALLNLVVGDLSGAVLGAAGLVLLRMRSRMGLALSALLVVATVADAARGAYLRGIEPPRPDPAGVWWMIFVFFAPLVVVSLPLIVWQLYARRAEPLKAPFPADGSSLRVPVR
jgi:hypothetical protein